MFDDEELGVQVIELLGRCCVAFPCSSILRHLCLHVKVRRVWSKPQMKERICKQEN